MNFIKEVDYSKRPLTRVELHIHLDGSIRYGTIWEYAQKKQIDLGVTSVVAIEHWLKKTTSTNLADFLEHFAKVVQPFQDDQEAWARIAYELCEDQFREGVLYFEARYAPQLLRTAKSRFSDEDVLLAVQKGLDKGREKFGVRSKQVICCTQERDSWAWDNLKLCEKFPNLVGGIDIAKNEAIHAGYTPTEIEVYRQARLSGVNRTAHAGESGPWTTVREAMDLLRCQRVGHGYRVFDDASGLCYKQAREQDLHFEVCPISSVLTGGCPTFASKHAVVRFAEDGTNFSVSKDDTMITGSTLDDEYCFLHSLGLTEAHFIRANLNAARSCFLPPQEKQSLISDLYKAYGIHSRL